MLNYVGLSALTMEEISGLLDAEKIAQVYGKGSISFEVFGMYYLIEDGLGHYVQAQLYNISPVAVEDEDDPNVLSQLEYVRDWFQVS